MVKVNTDNLHGKNAVSGVRQTKQERAEKTANTAGSAPAGQVKTSPDKDKVELSGKGAEFGKLIDQVKQLPDVRQDRVNEIKQKIAAGNYQPSAEDIADAILKDEQ
jgi:flagellar biosynthesis anti-sigma factor FlgM